MGGHITPEDWATSSYPPLANYESTELPVLATWEELNPEAAAAVQADMVNHPPHYTGYVGFEVIDIVEQLDYLRGTAVKYIMRAGSKWDEAEDIRKAIWYLTRYLEKLTNKIE